MLIGQLSKKSGYSRDSIRFYEKLGFSVVGEEDIDIGQGYFMNDFVMEKKLSDANLSELHELNVQQGMSDTE